MSVIVRPSTAFPLSHGKKRPREKNEAHLDFLRSLRCILTGMPAEATHLRLGDFRYGKPSTGMSEKPSDKWCVPLAPEMHRIGRDSQHGMNESTFWQTNNVQPLVIAALLWSVSGDQEAGEMICRYAREIAPWR